MRDNEFQPESLYSATISIKCQWSIKTFQTDEIKAIVRMLNQNEGGKEEGKTLKTGDPIQNRYKKKAQGGNRQRSVSSGTEATAESEASV